MVDINLFLFTESLSRTIFPDLHHPASDIASSHELLSAIHPTPQPRTTHPTTATQMPTGDPHWQYHVSTLSPEPSLLRKIISQSITKVSGDIRPKNMDVTSGKLADVVGEAVSIPINIKISFPDNIRIGNVVYPLKMQFAKKVPMSHHVSGKWRTVRARRETFLFSPIDRLSYKWYCLDIPLHACVRCTPEMLAKCGNTITGKRFVLGQTISGS